MARRKKSKQSLEMEPSNNLLHYLDKVLAFLISDDKYHIFPTLTVEIEDILIRIAKDTEFLKQGTFDDDCKSIVAEISAVLEKNNNLFTLSYGFENNDLGKKVMVYKKTLPVHVFKEPMPFKPLRRPKLIQPSKSNDSNPSIVMSSFKTTSLNATLKFVKNDAQLVLQYPHMTTEQADFVKQMITQCMAPQERNESGFKGLFDPLTEALKIFSLKYQFELIAETLGDMKRMKFEKTLKRNADDKKDLDSSFSSFCSDSSVHNTKKIKKIGHLVEAMSKLDSPFIDTALNRLNDFLKDSTKDDLVLSDLNTNEMMFLTHWKGISKRVEILKMFDVKRQMVLDEIRHGLERSHGRFRVKVTSEVLASNSRSVTFTKAPMKVRLSRAPQKTPLAPVNNVKNGTTVPTKPGPMLDTPIRDSSLSSSSSESGDRVQIANEKKITRFFSKTKTLTNTWIKNTLTEMKSFIQDESQASLIIPSINSAQMAFLTKWRQILSKAEVIQTYSADVQSILRALNFAVFVNAFKFKVSSKMSCVRKGNIRDITFTKTPVFHSLQPKGQQTKLKENVNTEININKLETPVTARTSLQDTSSPPTAAPSLSKTASVTSLRLPVDKSRVVNDKERPKSATGTIRRTITKLPPAKVKLIEGLNQPVVSEKGLKMMRSMGWDGGALGLRGEGITEPIMLQLDMGKRAGLGSAKPPSRQPTMPVMTNLPLDITRVVVPYTPEKTEFKTGILQSILKMLSEKRIATELRFPMKLTLKNWSFVRHHVTVFNNRDKISKDPSPLNVLCHTILDLMKKTELVITACWGSSKTNVLIVLSKSLYQPTDIDSDDWCSVASFDNSSVKVKGTSNICPSASNSGPVMVDGEPFRYYVMAQILEFCQRSNIVIDKGPSKGAIEKNIQLRGVMAPKQMAYIEDLIRRLNSRSKSGLVSQHENSLFDNIKAKIEGFKLKVDFPLMTASDENVSPIYKIIRLSKIFEVQKTAQISKKITATDKGSIGKIEIRSVESINDHAVNKEARKVAKKDRSLSSTIETTKIKQKYSRNYIDFVNKKAQDESNDILKNVTESQNSDNHYFDANDINNCICCLPDYDDDQTENKTEIIEENQMTDKECVEYIFIEKESVHPITDIGRPIIDDVQKYRQINTDSDKNNGRSLGNQSDKVNDMPIVTDSDKENDMTVVTDSDMSIVTSDKENVKPIVAERDKTNNTPIVTGSDKENDRPIVADSDKENDTPVVTDSDMPILTYSDKENVKPIVAERDQKNNTPIVSDNDKENNRPIVTDGDMSIVTNIDKENDGQMVTKNDSYIEDILHKHADIISTSTEMIDENLISLQNMNHNSHKILDSVDDHIKRELLKKIELFKQIESTFKDRNESNQDCLDKNEGSHEKENQIIAKKDKDLGKRLRSNAQTPERLNKKCRYADFVKHISITPKDYPQSKITNKMATEIQKSILNSIDYTQELPLLKCYGIQDGALSYSCHSEKSLNIIENVIKSLDLQAIVNPEINVTRIKMAFRLNTYLDESVNTILERLKIYNPSLSTKEWVVIKKEQSSDYVVIQLEMDFNSFIFIRHERFSLYAGLDVAKFSIVWA